MRSGKAWEQGHAVWESLGTRSCRSEKAWEQGHAGLGKPGNKANLSKYMFVQRHEKYKITRVHGCLHVHTPPCYFLVTCMEAWHTLVPFTVHCIICMYIVNCKQ